MCTGATGNTDVCTHSVLSPPAGTRLHHGGHWAGKRQRIPTQPSRSRRQPHRPAPTYTPPPVSARARTCAPRSNSWPCRPRVDAPGHRGVYQRPPRPCTRYPASPMRVRMRQPTYRAGAGHRGTTRSAARQSLQRQPRRQHRHRRSAKRRCAATPQDSHAHRTFRTFQRPPRRHRAQAGRHISMHARVHVHRRRSGRARQRNARGQSSARRGPRTHAESALPGASTVAWRGQGARPLLNADVWGNERAR